MRDYIMFCRTFFLIALSCLLLINFAARGQTPSSRVAKTTTVAAQPVVTELTVDSLKALLKRNSSRPLLINFWATWCDPCRDEFPDLVKVDALYRSRNLDFVTISLDDLKDIKTEVPKFLQQMNATMPAYLLNVSDPQLAINAVDPTWGGAMPATFLYDAKGVIIYKHFGRVDAADLRSAIDKILDHKE
ncbi:MAG: redoxin domain-containing protein [Pyrinomonadaceae bacterium]